MSKKASLTNLGETIEAAGIKVSDNIIKSFSIPVSQDTEAVIRVIDNGNAKNYLVKVTVEKKLQDNRSFVDILFTKYLRKPVSGTIDNFQLLNTLVNRSFEINGVIHQFMTNRSWMKDASVESAKKE